MRASRLQQLHFAGNDDIVEKIRNAKMFLKQRAQAIGYNCSIKPILKFLP
jgi:hypothetical protein